MFAWARQKMPSNETKAFFTDLADHDSNRSGVLSMVTEKTTVINRMQARFLEKDPVYWEILLLINTHFGHISFSPEKLAKYFGYDVSVMKMYLRELFDFGLVDKNKKGEFLTKEWVYVPYDKEFQSLREKNFKRAYRQFNKLHTEDKFRTTTTRLLTPSQKKDVEIAITSLRNKIIDLPESVAPPKSKPYTLGMFFSPRQVGHD